MQVQLVQNSSLLSVQHKCNYRVDMASLSRQTSLKKKKQQRWSLSEMSAVKNDLYKK